jgi:hypothetical protein
LERPEIETTPDAGESSPLHLEPEARPSAGTPSIQRPPMLPAPDAANEG